MTAPIHRDAPSAWHYLCNLGGIELNGRDEGLDKRIQKRLNPGAASFEEAIAAASVEAFVRAFFESIHPYVDMFRSILEFFERADATQGKSQWRLQVDDVDIDLEHFREWIAIWDNLAKTDVQIPAIDSKSVWQLSEILRQRQLIEDEFQRSFNKEPLNVPDDIKAWVSAYDRGIYLPLPKSLVSPEFPQELSKSVTIALAALQRLLDLKLNKPSLERLYKPGAMDPSDALDFQTIAQNETDLWLRSFIIELSAAATLLPDAELPSLGEELDEITNKFPTRPFQVNVVISDLESILSLPIWEKRYDLYSVWIATEVIRALKGHDIEIHHDNGKIAFAFKETLVATIHSSCEPCTLVSERRIPLENPQGEGRKKGVQPDYGLWMAVYGQKICRMAIEVKHYKNSSKTKFVHIFNDYARALPQAFVFLVNHGPVGKAADAVPGRLRDRCKAIGHLTPSNLEARHEFATAVQTCVGEPLPRWPHDSELDEAATVLLFDVSGSMKSKMRSKAMNAFVCSLAASELPAKLVAADCTIISTFNTSEKGFAELLHINGGSTDLSGPVVELLKTYESVLVVTDDGGLFTIQGIATAHHNSDARAPSGIRVRVCRRA